MTGALKLDRTRLYTCSRLSNGNDGLEPGKVFRGPPESKTQRADSILKRMLQVCCGPTKEHELSQRGEFDTPAE